MGGAAVIRRYRAALSSRDFETAAALLDPQPAEIRVFPSLAAARTAVSVA